MTKVNGSTDGAPERTRRPRNRKTLLTHGAAELFARAGYHQVGIDDIAAAVGITGGAVYRHFRGKQELLASAVLDGLDVIELAVDHKRADPDPADLPAMLRNLAAAALDRREYAVLWQREALHLDQGARAELRHRFRAIGQRAATVLQAARPDLSPADADFLVWCTFAVFASPSHHRVTLPRVRFEPLLFELGLAVSRTRSLPSRPDRAHHATPSTEGTAGMRPAARRETLLNVATRLLAERGYAGVSMDDIGAAAGISGASVYAHFSTKADLLMAIHRRGGESLQLRLSQALAATSIPQEALARVLRSYVEFALENTDLFRILITETLHLPEPERHVVRSDQHDYVYEWVHLLRMLRPALSEPEARVVVQAVIGIVNDIARIPRMRARPNLGVDLVALGMDLLTQHTGRGVALIEARSKAPPTNPAIT